jgi:hypothetical protein
VVPLAQLLSDLLLAKVEDPDPEDAMPAMLPTRLSDAQQAFVRAAEVAGATAPARACPLTALPRLSARELDELVELGLVREAADWSYYVFESRRPDGTGIRADVVEPRRTHWRRANLVRVAVFWLVLILIPILLLKLFAG